MKTTKFIAIIVLLCGLGACTKNNFIDTGICNGRFDGSLLEYLEAPANSYNWDSTALMVYRAGDDVVRLFEGQDPDHPEITFLGITNHSIRRYLLERGLSQVADLTPEFCKKVLLCHVLDGKLWRDSIPLGEDGQGGNLIKGGAYYTTLGGTRLAMYTKRGSWQGISDIGALAITIKSTHTLLKLEDVVSTNIEPDHSLVHAMAYYYDWTNMSDDLR
ncbi:MAG: hypothetical protein ACLSDJ_00900 [Butyricimonas faecihominis]|uniref:hypothetical protein n=1 Tax=Butyricimonas TaxID=574697 RepID=UPI0009682E7F|nr:MULTISPECIES: hypothetical protein [Butyricimonas]OKZ19229.1 MAG: hypothetical protein BHV81_05915 [Butyricimonas synergistica]